MDRITFCSLPTQKSCYLCCLLPTQNLVFYDFFILWRAQDYMVSVAITKILFHMNYFSTDRSTVHGVRCQHKNLVLHVYDLFIQWTGVCGLGFRCQHKHLIFYGQEYMVPVVNTNLLFSTTYLFYEQEYMVSVAIRKILFSINYISMNRSTWCLLPTQKSCFQGLIYYLFYG